MSVHQPVFILASPRSFTSLVCTMLGQHPEAYGVPEINLFVTETMAQLVKLTRGKRQFMIHGLWRTIAQLYAGEQTMQSIDMARRWINRRLHCSTGEVYTELCQKVDPLCIVDKSPAYSKNLKAMRRMQKTFPEARYLYLIRHPKDQGKSVMKAPQAIAALLASDSLDYSTNPPTIDPQFVWYETQLKIMEFLDTIPPHQQMRLRGEDLLNDPQLYLEQICRWLNLTWSESAYNAMLRTQDSPYACMGPFGAQAGNNPGFQNSPAFRYKPITPSKNAELLPWRKDQQGLLPEVLKMAQTFGYE